MNPYKQKQAEFSAQSPFSTDPAIYFVPDYSPVITGKKGDALQTPEKYFASWIASEKHSAQFDIALVPSELHEYNGSGVCSHFSHYKSGKAFYQIRKVGQCFKPAICFVIVCNVHDYLCEKHKQAYLKSFEIGQTLSKKRLEFLECFEGLYQTKLASGIGAEDAANGAQLKACEELKIKP